MPNKRMIQVVDFKGAPKEVEFVAENGLLFIGKHANAGWKWSVYHKPTKMRVFTFRLRVQAKKFIEKMGDHPDWRLRFGNKSKDRKEKKRFAAICGAVVNQIERGEV